MKFSKRTEITVVVFLAVLIAGAFVYLWAFGATGLPENDRKEVNTGVILLAIWLVPSLILAPLFAKLMGWGFRLLGSNEPANEAKQLQEEKDTSPPGPGQHLPPEP